MWQIQDMVVIRHSGGSDQRTTLILLCEDGSLKIYMANSENTSYWMQPSLQPHPVMGAVGSGKKSKKIKRLKGSIYSKHSRLVAV